MEKIKNKIEKIQKIINKQGKHGYYLVDENTVKLVSKGHNRTDTKNEALEKVNGKKKYINQFIYLVDVHINPKFIGKDDPIITGPVSLKIKEYQITKNYKFVHKADFKLGAIWYTNTDIKNGAFHFIDIKKIIYEVCDKNMEIISAGGVRAVDVLENAES